ncbi:ATP-binding cassette domain-containing protein [Streptomyces scabiei]|uniref:ABC transporter ATP-binding protein n=1 Tax=Streptomyces scabiei TaxID=1930 RepID=UPI001B315A7A|nr:ATP-binding cassette domain-containing protein [Streptomyces sp. LBUM 1484]MBP5876369.1 ATP-binding cassette domain-containing protein [Streptomyces sp. LBUM 1477]MBP5884115.1 ATP-binding cassette domain-containing protein [Streptomyces sp. LBUM 1487]MBP5900129.1 ATP-binding cassette domain-containing protein [Streptomyces sp. LBUM 1488]MBP5916308.1 ATP-binding cassette domain-containing protein [Streptomyces sp. LBUM 1486]MDX3169238.1 ATP-binding cassette domain-containing protein [Strepto
MIEARGLSKVFRTTVRRPGLAGALRSLVSPQRVDKVAVRDVEFSVGRGELLALLGPNGAGKSTTIKMLTGILTPTSGEAVVAGVVPHRDRERNAHNIGAVFGQRTQLWWDLPARDSFEILRDIYGVPEAQFRDRIEEFDGLLELSEFWDTRVRHLSLGQRVRCDLAASLLHDPPVVFLDEPTIGMDVVVKEQVRRFLRHQVEQRDRTVLLTTHDMTEVERLAERVVLINHGRIVLDGSLQEIRRRFGGTWQVRATLADPADVDIVAAVPPVGAVGAVGVVGAVEQGGAGAGAPVPLPGFAGIGVLRREGPRVVFGPVGEDPPGVHEALKVIIGRFRVADLALEENDLEDVMRAAYLSDLPPAGPTAGPTAEAPSGTPIDGSSGTPTADQAPAAPTPPATPTPPVTSASASASPSQGG